MDLDVNLISSATFTDKFKHVTTLILFLLLLLKKKRTNFTDLIDKVLVSTWIKVYIGLPSRNMIAASFSYQSRSSHLRNFTNFIGKHLCQSLFFNKIADLRPATLLKKRLWHKCFPVNFVYFLRTPFSQNISGWLLLSLERLFLNLLDS